MLKSLNATSKFEVTKAETNPINFEKSTEATSALQTDISVDKDNNAD